MDNNNEDHANGYANYPNLEDQENSGSNNEKNVQENVDDSSSQQTNSANLPESDFDFWKVNSYKKTVRRVDDGVKIADDFMKMVSERAEIESQYSTKLQGWSKKWTDTITKGPEYKACKSTLLEFTQEAQKLAEIHSELQNLLINNVHNNISTWKSENYHKSLLSWKETKHAEDGFSKAQKPWAKKYDEVMKCKKSYYSACRAKDQAEKLYSNSTMESNNTTEEQTKKLKEKLSKAEGDVSTTRAKYQEAIRDITNYNPKYKDDMVFVFDKLQAAEEKRKVFMKNTMKLLCKSLDPGQFFERLAMMYDHLCHVIDNFTPADDVTWWSVTYGKDMLVTWLQFEEYDPGAPDATDGQPQQPTTTTDKDDAQPTGKSSVCATL